MHKLAKLLLAALIQIVCVRAQTLTLDPSYNLNVGAIVAASPSGTHFVFRPGIYRNVQIVPKDNDLFTGSPGAILNGSVPVSGVVRSGSLWAIPSQFQRGQVIGQCDDNHPLCGHPDDLFFDDMPLIPVGSIGSVTSGTFFFDYAGHTIYLADDPTNHKLEVSITASAFIGSAANVTIQGLTIEKYSNPAQMGAIGGQYPGVNWAVSNCEVRLNHSIGIAAASGSTISNNYLHHNGQIGIATSERAATNNLTVTGNQISFNNWAGFVTGWQAGGLKATNSSNLLASANYIHDNLGNGLWCDLGCIGAQIKDNVVKNNLGNGILYEISYRASITGNTSAWNYVPGNPWYWGAQIALQNSRDVDISGNTVETAPDRGNGIVLINQDRSDAGIGLYGPFNSVNNYVHNNSITCDGPTVYNVTGHPQGSSGLAGDYDVDAFLSLNNNRFDSNQYHLPDPNSYHWIMIQALTWRAFQAAGQEAQGSIYVLAN